MSSDVHAHAHTHTHTHARTHAHTRTRTRTCARAHSRTISAGQEYELPPLQKGLGDKEDAWAIKDGNGRTVLKLCFVTFSFRDDMKKLIEGFLKPPSSEAAEQPALRQFRLSELLLVAFMKDMIATCPDDEIAENLEVWQGKCEDPEGNLITAFGELMLSLKPSVLNDIGYDFAESSRPNHTSIFAIDWMVQHSKSALPRAKKDEWIKEVVLDWFVSGNTESADGFLERAEKFLQKGVKGESWGAKILGKNLLPFSS
jgi:hypothetical protein